jgi:K+-sensing histidine kinase KdpD
MTQILRNPLSALRASMETLASEFRADDPRSLKLSGALEQVLSMSRDVDALLALASPRPLAPLTCSVDEILEASLRRQGFASRARVRLARPATPPTLRVDGPLLADCLARLLEYSLAAGGDSVLLSARRDGRVTRFSIVSGSDAANAEPEQLNHHKRAALELGMALARRDAQRMQSVLEITRSERGHLLLNLCVPDAPDGEERAAS